MAEYYQVKDGILEKYTGREEEITVPEGIHTIGEGAFKGCVSLKKVILPSGLRRIMGDAFKGCRRLEFVEIPEGTAYIGPYAFHRCHELKQAVLPASVEELGDCAFLYCDSMTQVRIPGVKRLGTQAFANGILLERLEISRDLEAGCICDVFTGCGRVTEISFPDGECFRMPNVVEAVQGEIQAPPLARLIVEDILRMMELEGRCLLRFRVNIKHVEVPEGIESLGRSCFYDMRGILSIKLPKSLKRIESRAFRNCIGLEKVSFEGTRVTIDKDAFRNCTSLKTVRTSDGEEYVFEGISKIIKVSAEKRGLDSDVIPDVAGKRASDTTPDSGGNTDSDMVPELVRVIQRQVLGNFRLSGTILLKYLGAETRVIVPDGITSIAEEAFAGNETIDKVFLPESLREIGAEAFRGCLLLQTISLPEKLERIGAGAFERCVKLRYVRLPSKIAALEARVFRHCRALQEVQFPEALAEIRESAFYGCDALRKVQFPENLNLIGEMAFYRCGSLKEVCLPAKADYVKSLAFAKSGVRRVRILGGDGNGLKGRMYGEDVFGDCGRLKTLILEEGVRHIPDKLAYGCVSLEHVVLPQSLESAGRHPWEGTIFLEEWRKRQAIRQREDAGRQEAERRWEETGRRQAEEAEVRQEETGRQEGERKKIAAEERIFWDGRKLEGEVWLPESVSIVAGGAFYGNEKVTELHLPEGVRSIGAAACKGCRRLRRVWLPAGIRRLEAEVFSGCAALEEVSAIGECLPAWQKIGERAFYRCGKLRRLNLAEAKIIEKEALAHCVSLTRSRLGAGLRMGERAFEDTCFLREGESGCCIVGDIVVSGEACGGEVSLPEGAVGIGPYAFAGNRRITRLVLPESLEWIGEGAFFGCSGLESVNFPEKLREIGARAFEKCISLREAAGAVWQAGPSAFAGCVSLKKVFLPKLSMLQKRLFAGCASLEECVCGNAKAAQAFCFSGCEKLTSFDFHRLYVVKEYAFEQCESLITAEFRDGACLREHAFEDCCGLEKIILEGGIYLREYALSGCTALSQVVYGDGEWTLHSYGDIFSERIPETARLLFHSALSCFEIEEEGVLRGYRGAARKVKIPEGVRRIEAEVFRDVMMLREVEIPDSVEYIGARAFHGTAWMDERRRKESCVEEQPLVVVKDMLLDGSGCRGTVTVPEDIRLVCGWAFANGLEIERIRFLSDRVRVEEYAFRNCIHLREIILPDGSCVKFTGIEDRKKELSPLAKQAVTDSLNCFKTDGEGVLVECTGNISVLTLAHGITAIGEGAFQDGNLLTQVTFPETVKKIGKRAFAGCKWLGEVRQAGEVEEIGELAFSGCGTLRRVELSDKLRRIGARAFENCTSLEEIWIPEGVEEIPERAFYRCRSLKSIRIPSTVKRIGKEAFGFCGAVSEIRLPEGVEIGERAFVGSCPPGKSYFNLSKSNRL